MDAQKLYEKKKREAAANGYFLNPDREFTLALMESLLANEKRYGYQACPCRLAEGSREKDLDIICPCDYRDQDLVEYGACYCGLYVSKEISEGNKELLSIPERRGREENTKEGAAELKISFPVYRCKVCGYLCGREQPPEICPICKASGDRFELFIKKE
ncbi:MAG: ferredoxin-thioredoxin reductase catalytic domain-containing protein [Actinomycetota bacterium]